MSVTRDEILEVTGDAWPRVSLYDWFERTLPDRDELDQRISRLVLARIEAGEQNDLRVVISLEPVDPAAPNVGEQDDRVLTVVFVEGLLAAVRENREEESGEEE